MENSGNSIIAQTKSKKKTYIIGGILFAILLLVGAAATFWLTQQEQDVRQQASVYGIADGECKPPGEICNSGYEETDNSCDLSFKRCIAKPANTTHTIKKQDDGECLLPKDDTNLIIWECESGKSFLDTMCSGTNKRCGEKNQTILRKDGECLPETTATQTFECESGNIFHDPSCLAGIRCGGATTIKLQDDGQCLPENKYSFDWSCKSGKSYSDATCSETGKRCGEENQTIGIDDNYCLRASTSTTTYLCSSGTSYDDSLCVNTGQRCGIKPINENLGGGTSGGGVCEHISQYEKNPLQSCPAGYTELSYDHCMERECVDDQMCEFWAVDCCSQLGTGEDSNTCTGQIAGFVTKKLNCEYDPACDDQPTTSPSPVIGPQCLSISMSIANPKINDSVTFTCGQVTGANEYIFRVKTPDGEIASLGKSSSRVSPAFVITQSGSHTAQCQICIGGTCKPWESLD